VRISPLRAPGESNVEYEVALLAHLKRAGASVAAASPSNSGDLSIEVRAAEGARKLVVFEYVSGDEPGDNLANIALIGEGLARIHVLGQSYSGPSSVCPIDADHLVQRRLRRLLSFPVVDEALRDGFTRIADELARDVASRASLSQVVCHGDCHPGNVLMQRSSKDEWVASFFDFEDGGHGYLAYDLSVFLHSELVAIDAAMPTEPVRDRWKHFLDGYRRVARIPEADLDAIPSFLSARHIWWMGAFAGRADDWGTQMMPLPWLRKQVERLSAWRGARRIGEG
jgi:Ser/Thr protein kinase RdoA (MazF antagonist)